MRSTRHSMKFYQFHEEVVQRRKTRHSMTNLQFQRCSVMDLLDILYSFHYLEQRHINYSRGSQRDKVRQENVEERMSRIRVPLSRFPIQPILVSMHQHDHQNMRQESNRKSLQCRSLRIGKKGNKKLSHCRDRVSKFFVFYRSNKILLPLAMKPVFRDCNPNRRSIVVITTFMNPLTTKPVCVGNEKEKCRHIKMGI